MAGRCPRELDRPAHFPPNVLTSGFRQLRIGNTNVELERVAAALPSSPSIRPYRNKFQAESTTSSAMTRLRQEASELTVCTCSGFPNCVASPRPLVIAVQLFSSVSVGCRISNSGFGRLSLDLRRRPSSPPFVVVGKRACPPRRASRYKFDGRWGEMSVLPGSVDSQRRKRFRTSYGLHINHRWNDEQSATLPLRQTSISISPDISCCGCYAFLI